MTTAINILDEVQKLRDDLYDNLPSGEIKVWDLLVLVNQHIQDMDSCISRIQALGDGWIAVSEKRPENNQSVLFSRGIHTALGFYIDPLGFQEEYNTGYSDAEFWMPLPLTPQ